MARAKLTGTVRECLDDAGVADYFMVRKAHAVVDGIEGHITLYYTCNPPPPPSRVALIGFDVNGNGQVTKHTYSMSDGTETVEKFPRKQ